MNKKEIAPTLTLAQIYQSQNQLPEALAIYNKIFSHDESDFVADRMEKVYDKLFDENSSQYNPIINEIFSQKEKKKFIILPAEQYDRFEKVLENKEENLQEELETEVDEELEESKLETEAIPENFNDSGVVSFFNKKNDLSEISSKDIKNKSDKSLVMKNMTVKDLFETVSTIVKPNTKIADITIGDIFEIIKRMG